MGTGLFRAILRGTARRRFPIRSHCPVENGGRFIRHEWKQFLLIPYASWGRLGRSPSADPLRVPKFCSAARCDAPGLPKRRCRLPRRTNPKIISCLRSFLPLAIGPDCGAEFALQPNFDTGAGIEEIAQAVANEIKRKHGEHHGEGRKDHEMR